MKELIHDAQNIHKVHTAYTYNTHCNEAERPRRTDGAGGGSVDMDVSTEVNAAKSTLKYLNKTKKSLVY